MIQNNKVVVFVYEYHYFCFIGQNMEMIISKNELNQVNLQDIIKIRKINYEMINETTHKTYKLGQKVEVVTIGTDKLARTIDFMFAEDYDAQYN